MEEGKKVIRLQEIKQEIKALQEEAAGITEEVVGWMESNDLKKADTPHGRITLVPSTRYIFSEEVEAIEEELKAQKDVEKAKAMTREDWEKAGRPHEVAVMETKNHLRFTPKKEK